MSDNKDVRVVMLTAASKLLTGGPCTQYGYTYTGEEAVQKGMELVSLIQMFDRRFSNK